jgi:hypothetical protein
MSYNVLTLIITFLEVGVLHCFLLNMKMFYTMHGLGQFNPKFNPISIYVQCNIEISFKFVI